MGTQKIVPYKKIKLSHIASMADSAAYLSMAEQGVWAGGASPHRYRILVPLLLLQTGFLSIHFLSMTDVQNPNG